MNMNIIQKQFHYSILVVSAWAYYFCFKPLIDLYLLDKWQAEWEECQNNKLFELNAVVGKIRIYQILTVHM